MRPLRSLLAVFLNACRMVSMVSSPPSGGGLPDDWGLPRPGPRARRPGEASRPWSEAGTLVGGVVPGPWEDTGERMGEGERLAAEKWMGEKGKELGRCSGS